MESTTDGPGGVTNVLILVAAIAGGLLGGRMVTDLLGVPGALSLVVSAVTTVISVVLVLLLYNRLFLS